jgi:chaperonin cofactor prefoldin
MNLKAKQQKLVDEYNQNQQQLRGLSIRQQQIVGQLQLIEELKKEKDVKKK